MSQLKVKKIPAIEFHWHGMIADSAPSLLMQYERRLRWLRRRSEPFRVRETVRELDAATARATVPRPSVCHAQLGI